MNHTLILYKSKYGSTKKYVEWIKEEVFCDVFEIESYHKKDFNSYDLVILAGGIYAGGISGIKFLKKNLTALSQKKIAVFAVGASSFDEKQFEQVKNQNLKGISNTIPIFYGRGAYDEDKMGFKDRTLCRMLKKALSKKDPATFEPWMKELFESEGQSFVWTDKKYLLPLLEFIKE